MKARRKFRAAWLKACTAPVVGRSGEVIPPAFLHSGPRLASQVNSSLTLAMTRSRIRCTHQVYGMLHLSAGLACAIQGDHNGARAHSAEAAEVAGPLGDRPAAFELCGPANVGVWRASLAVEAGTAEEALGYADTVEPRVLASSNRRAALRLEKARAFAMLGNDADAVRELRLAERLSPAQTRHHPLIRELVRDLLARARREAAGRDLRGIAWRMNII